jgi:histone-arginine methyltransferase CARM1
MDVGAGSGILSFFAAQAGASRVFAVEASDMARHAEQLAKANPALADRVTVLQGKVRPAPTPESPIRVDTMR